MARPPKNPFDLWKARQDAIAAGEEIDMPPEDLHLSPEPELDPIEDYHMDPYDAKAAQEAEILRDYERTEVASDAYAKQDYNEWAQNELEIGPDWERGLQNSDFQNEGIEHLGPTGGSMEGLIPKLPGAPTGPGDGIELMPDRNPLDPGDGIELMPDRSPLDPGDGIELLGSKEGSIVGQDPRLGGPEETFGSEYDKYAKLTPEERRIVDANDALKRGEALRNKQEEGLANQRRMTANNLKDAKGAVEQASRRTEHLMRQAKAIGEKEIDTGRWWGSRSSAQKIALGFAAMIGGALNPGGKNSTLDMIQNEMDRDINAQIHDIKNARAGVNQQQGLVKTLYDQGMTLVEAGETARIAAYDRMGAELAMEAAKFDPMGTQVKKYYDDAQRLATLADASRRKLAKENLNTIHDLNDQRRKNDAGIRAQEMHAQKLELGAEKLRLDKRKGRGSGRKRINPASLSEMQKANPDYQGNWIRDAQGGWSMDPNYKAPVDAEGNPVLTGKQLERKKLVGDIKGQETRTADMELKTERSRAAIRVVSLKTKSGDPYQAKTPGLAEELDTQIPAVERSIAMLDDMLELHDDGIREWFGSEGGKLLDAKLDALVLEVRKAEGTGALDDGSVKIIRGKLTGGGKTPSKTVRSFKAALRAARNDIEASLNTKIKHSIMPDTGAHEPWKARPAPKSMGSRDKMKKGNRLSQMNAGMPPGVKDNPELLRTYVKDQVQVTSDMIARDKPGVGDLASYVNTVRLQLNSGEIDDSTAAELVTPTAKELAKKELMSLGTGKTKLKPEDLAVRAELLQGVLGGDPDAILKYIKPGHVVPRELGAGTVIKDDGS